MKCKIDLEQKKIIEQFNEIRNKTLDLVKNLESDDFIVQNEPYTSPIKWHIGHVSWIYEVVMSKIDKNFRFFSDEFSNYLNSYYNQFGEPQDKGSRGIVSRPTTNQIFQYFNSVNKKFREFILINPLREDTIKLIKIGFHHECQHQELLIYDLQHLLAEKYRPINSKRKPSPSVLKKNPLRIKGGVFVMGYSGTNFSYDIELPEHKIYLNDYVMDKFPVTNEQYLRFMEDGGYENYRYWLSDGWEIVKKEELNSPMYWEKIDGQWKVKKFFGFEKLNPKEPVCHVNYYEAEAYCKWTNKRLPTEGEWEKASCWDEEKLQKRIFPWGNDPPNSHNSNLLESYHWGCTEIGSYPLGKSPYGCHQMIGDIWEWTSSDFVGYPGFKSGFEEYNDKWFANQKVLRGGSFGTPRMSIRNSYRNFFRLGERWMFSGFRCADDI